MKREVKFVFKWLAIVIAITIPIVGYVAIKSSVESTGRRIEGIEREIVVVKKSINNLERIFSEQIDYKKVEKKAKEMGLNYINVNKNKVLVVKGDYE